VAQLHSVTVSECGARKQIMGITALKLAVDQSYGHHCKLATDGNIRRIYFNNEYTKQISQARYSTKATTLLAQEQFHSIIPVHLSVLLSIQFKK
jgi:hypothetical protein